MVVSKSLMARAGLLMLVSAALHIGTALFVSGQVSVVNQLVMAVVFIVLAIGLLHDRRWMAYLSYLVLLVGTIAAYLWSATSHLFTLIALLNLCALVLLFVALWKARQKSTA